MPDQKPLTADFTTENTEFKAEHRATRTIMDGPSLPLDAPRCPSMPLDSDARFGCSIRGTASKTEAVQLKPIQQLVQTFVECLIDAVADFVLQFIDTELFLELLNAQILN